jgi:ATP-dependent exoDNAse (exonuclease V) beta subunit
MWAHEHGSRRWHTKWLGDLEDLKEAWPGRQGSVIVSTIHAFKGLERPVVIVSELEGIDPVEQQELLYVAFSRARQHLIVAGLDGLDRLGELLAARESSLPD